MPALWSGRERFLGMRGSASFRVCGGGSSGPTPCWPRKPAGTLSMLWTSFMPPTPTPTPKVPTHTTSSPMHDRAELACSLARVGCGHSLLFQDAVHAMQKTSTHISRRRPPAATSSAAVSELSNSTPSASVVAGNSPSSGDSNQEGGGSAAAGGAVQGGSLPPLHRGSSGTSDKGEGGVAWGRWVGGWAGVGGGECVLAHALLLR
jgi:hypothetical protein